MIKSFYNRGLVRTSTIQSSALVGAGVDSLRAARAGLGEAPSLRYAVSFMFIFAVVAVAFYK